MIHLVCLRTLKLMEESARSGHIPAKERAAADTVLCIHLESEKEKERKRAYIFTSSRIILQKPIFMGHTGLQTLLLSLLRA